jgi:NADH-quinone oxidoreductase subunit E
VTTTACGCNDGKVKADIDPILAQYPNAARDALIPILQDVQETHGYLSEDAIVRIGAHLKLPTSKIYGVATFYNQFRFQPLGRFHLQICRGTACHVKGSLSVLDAVRHELKIEPGQTSRDGLFSLEVVACIGACGLAPLICVSGEFHAEMTSNKVRDLIEELREEAEENHD